MSKEVADLVLRNNERQNRAISLVALQSNDYLELYRRFIEEQAQSGKLNPQLEFLPDDNVFLERKANQKGLTHPEIAVLLAYCKIILKEEILKSDLPENKHFISYIESEFPMPLRQKYRLRMEKHRLHREIIATQFSNDLVNDMGFAFIHQMYDETSAAPATIVCAYVAARAIFRSHELWKEIEALEGKIESKIQKDLMIEVVRLVRRATRWLLRNRPSYKELTDTINLFSKQTN